MNFSIVAKVDQPLVAVFMVTYNHEKYLDKAIQSVINQRADFKFQLFIGEDKSTDSSITICRKYEEEFPEIVHVISSDTNIGIYRNAGRVFEACIASGAKYIALLEGDDYWCSPDKLQRQVTILESDSAIAGSYHNTQFLYSNGEFKTMKKALPETLELKDVVSKYAPFHTSSFVFRSVHFCRPEWFKKIDSVDLAMYAWHAQFGRLVGINEVMSVYRIHGTSLTASSEHRDFFDDRRVILHRMMRGKINHQLFGQYNDLIQFHQPKASGKWKESLKHAVAFCCSAECEMSNELKFFRMALDAEVVNFQLACPNKWVVHDRYFSMFSLVKNWNRFQWKRAMKAAIQRAPDTIVFTEKSDYQLFKKKMGAMKVKVILLFPLSSEQINEDLKTYPEVISKDWKTMNVEQRREFELNWNR